LGRWKIVVLAIIGLVIVAVVAIVLLLANEPEPAEPPCKPLEPCVLSRSPGAVGLGTLWESRELGYSFEYPKFLRVAAEDGRSVQLGISTTSGFDIQIWVSGARAGSSSIDALVTARRNALAERVMAPGLGFLRGAGGAYSGTLDSPTGPSSPASVAILAAGDGRVNVVLSILITGQDLDHKAIQNLRNATGVLINNTVRYR
jgi:hypothetical protein